MKSKFAKGANVPSFNILQHSLSIKIPPVFRYRYSSSKQGKTF